MSSSRVTMKDIAAKLGVSVNTVHKVVANKPGVSDAVRAKVLLAADEMGYCRNESASVLRRRDLKVVVCLPSAEQEGSFYFVYLWRGVERYEAEARDHGMVFDARPFAIGGYAQVLEEVLEQAEAGERPDGLIAYAPVEPGTVELQTKISKLGVSVVLVDGDCPHTGRLGATVAGCSEAGSLMAEQAANLLPGAPAQRRSCCLRATPTPTRTPTLPAPSTRISTNAASTTRSATSTARTSRSMSCEVRSRRFFPTPTRRGSCAASLPSAPRSWRTPLWSLGLWERFAGSRAAFFPRT